MVAACVGTDLERAAMAYIALALDKMVNYNAVQVRWHANREVVAGVFDRHNFSFYWSYAEMAPTITGLGYDWAIAQIGKALGELIELLGQSSDGKLEFAHRGLNRRSASPAHQPTTSRSKMRP
jgi:adenine-specific DNA methylase